MQSVRRDRPCRQPTSQRRGALVLGIFAAILAATDTAWGQGTPAVSFERLQLTSEYHSEGAGVGDFNRDGKLDVVSGPYWYAGPDFATRHAFDTPKDLPEEGGYAEGFFYYGDDLTGDGLDDVVMLPLPGRDAYWYQNPGTTSSGNWRKHLILRATDNESPEWGDLDGDGRKELICTHQERLAFVRPNPSQPTSPWEVTYVSPTGPFGKYTHGLGLGDVNQDGRADFIEANGWWEQPAEAGADWKPHRAAFGARPSQMHAYDVDGDGDNDIIAAFDAHGWGLAWYENTGDGFREHRILERDGRPNDHGVMFSQLHALALVDVDGDGLRDIVTGKCRYAHGPAGDPEPRAPAVLYWFQLRRGSTGIEWIPHRIDDNSGVGRQITIADLNEDTFPDIVVGNKRGTFVFLQRRTGKAAAASESLPKFIDREGYVDSDGTKIHYVTAGEGPLLVLIHGFPDYWYSWRHQIPALSRHHQVVAVDLRGYNKSDKPKGVGAYAMPTLVKDIANVVRHFRAEKAVIVGHDWGGAIAWTFAMTQPQMTERLIICNLPHPRGMLRELRTNPQQQKNSQYARAFQKEDAASRLNAGFLVGILGKLSDEEKRRYFAAFERSSFEGMLNYYKANYPRPPYAEQGELPKVQCRVLMLHGLDDSALLPAGLNDNWLWVERDLTLVTVPNAGHWVQHDAAEFVTRTMVRWLGDE